MVNHNINYSIIPHDVNKKVEWHRNVVVVADTKPIERRGVHVCSEISTIAKRSKYTALILALRKKLGKIVQI